MLSINDLKNGFFIVINNDPYIVLSVKHLHMGRGGSSVQTKIRHLRTGQVFERNFKPADSFESADVEKIKAKFIYNHRDEYWFSNNDIKGRFCLGRDIIGGSVDYLKPEMEITALKFKDKIINIELPIKADYKVKEAPPAIRGDTAQGGAKNVILETGVKIQTPLFINKGDIIRVNIYTGEYVERIEKAAD